MRYPARKASHVSKSLSRSLRFPAARQGGPDVLIIIDDIDDPGRRAALGLDQLRRRRERLDDRLRQELLDHGHHLLQLHRLGEMNAVVARAIRASVWVAISPVRITTGTGRSDAARTRAATWMPSAPPGRLKSAMTRSGLRMRRSTSSIPAAPSRPRSPYDPPRQAPVSVARGRPDHPRRRGSSGSVERR